MTDQTAKADAGKLRLSLVPPEVIKAVGIIRRYGNAKYPDGGEDNWKRVEPQRYWDAVIRHTVAAWSDYKAVDAESGYPHLYHIATNIAFILALEGMAQEDDHDTH